MKIRLTISLAMVMCLILAIIFATPIAADGVVVSVTVEGAQSVNVPAGSSFVASLDISEVEHFAGYEVIFLEYDPHVLNPTGVSSGIIGGKTIPVDAMVINYAGVPGHALIFGHISQAGGPNWADGTGNIVSVNFDVIGANGQTSLISITEVLLIDYHAGVILSDTPLSALVTVTPTEQPSGISVSPVSGELGVREFPVIINGANFTGTTSVSFGQGITVDHYVINNDNQITASISIAADAATGKRDIIITTPVGTGILAGGFTVDYPAAPFTSGTGFLIIIIGITVSMIILVQRKTPKPDSPLH